MFSSLNSETYKKPLDSRHENIKVIAVGGGGGNAINYIISCGLEKVEFMAFNTDATDLEKSIAENKLILGENITKGLGAGANPEIGEKSAIESAEKIKEFIKDADMVYITAGMGGGTGTGAAPIVAKIAKEMGILTVAVVTRPFYFEGKRKMKVADEGIEKLSQVVDAIIVISNQKLFDISDGSTSFTESFVLPNEVLRQAVQGVTDLVTKPGMINVDFADLKTVMSNSGYAVMGVGKGKGENKMVDAMEKALSSPLMELPPGEAKGVLMNISGGKDISITEVQQVASYIESIITDEAVFVWGLVEDASKENEAEITIIATGFDLNEVLQKKAASENTTKPKSTNPYEPYKPLYRQQETQPETIKLQEEPTKETDKTTNEKPEVPKYDQPPHKAHKGPDWLITTERTRTAPQLNDTNWDEPSFIRMGKKLKSNKVD
ncbi:MAG: cell division protein FtsZ [Synergistaceae bacterium]